MGESARNAGWTVGHLEGYDHGRAQGWMHRGEAEDVAWFWSQVAQAVLCREVLEWQRTGELPEWAR